MKSYILNNGHARVGDLQKAFPNVSSMTIRRDLAYLEQTGFVIRTHGGAKINPLSIIDKEDLYSHREIANIAAKQTIAKKAAHFMQERRFIFFDSGTTLMALAQSLPDDNFWIVTSGVNIALKLRLSSQNTSVTLVGGNISRNTLSVSGPSSLDFIRTCDIDVAFMGASGFSLEQGFTSGNFYEAQLKEAVIQKSKKVIMLTDTSKIGKNLTYTFAQLKDIGVMICESTPSDDICQALADLDILLV